MSWYEQRLKLWSDYVELVESLKLNEQGDHGWYLRGQSDSSWSLEPSLVRHLRRVNVERALGIEFGAFRRFQSQYHLYANADSVDRSSWGPIAWWMVMQHHSCPTRLLDWTLSPYVALYFAVEQHLDIDGAVWLFPSSALESISTSRFEELSKEDHSQLQTHEIQAVYPIEAAYHTERSAPQQAVFTVCTHVLGDHGLVIENAFRGQETRYPLHKIIVPAELKNEYLSRLRAMNITPSSLFPGLDGLGRAARDYVRLRAWRTHNEG